MTVLARIVRAHDDADYHEWITFNERVKADKTGRPSPRMHCAYWTRWFCNNTACAAEALVSDDAAKLAIEEAEGG